jgi:hypothetical protein
MRLALRRHNPSRILEMGGSSRSIGQSAMNKTLGVDLEGEFELSQKHPWDEHHATTTEKVPRIEEGTLLRTPYLLALSDVQPRILHNSPAKDANQTKLTSVDAVASADFFWWAQPVRLVNQLSNLSPETSSRAERIRHFAKGCRCNFVLSYHSQDHFPSLDRLPRLWEAS